MASPVALSHGERWVAVWLRGCAARELGNQVFGGLAQLSFLVKVRRWLRDDADLDGFAPFRRSCPWPPFAHSIGKSAAAARCLVVQPALGGRVCLRSGACGSFPTFPFLTAFPPRRPCPGCVGVLVTLAVVPSYSFFNAFVLLFLAASVAHVSGNEGFQTGAGSPQIIPNGRMPRLDSGHPAHNPKQTDLNDPILKKKILLCPNSSP